ncbi:hypothetical protein [Sphingobium yanoikuyae]|nr:hypothetical protein [Sphingobium yanoikuyae]
MNEHEATLLIRLADESPLYAIIGLIILRFRFPPTAIAAIALWAG